MQTLLPAACPHQVLLFDSGGGKPLHTAGYGFRRLGQNPGIVVMGSSQNDGSRAGDG